MRSLVVVSLLFLANLLFGGCSEEPKLASGKVVYDFLANVKSAQVAEYHRERVNFGLEFTINQEKRPIMFEHPSAEIQFDRVAIPQKAVLQFGIAINPEVWDKSGDGVTFEITVIDQKSAKIQIFSSYIDPKAKSSDRKWSDHDVDLTDFAGQTVSFIFATTPGPRGDPAYDWAGWSRPQVRLKSGA